ncbi:MAG TPA: hypothetical protein VEX36_12565 [Thermoleophilaceae bacterium]|nr:hypothetical protein [Thermoleophilaceae bacterium]
MDSEGHVWVADNAARAVVEYDAAGVATGNSIDTSSADPSGERGPCHMAFDSSDNLYVALYYGALHKYDASGAHVAEIDPEYTTAVAVDRSTDRVYSAHPGSNRVSAYDATGTRLYDVATEFTPLGVAINETTDHAYVSGYDNTVHVLGPPVVIAEPTTGAASDVELTSATLNGSVNLRSVALTDCRFEYGTDTSYGDSVPCVPAAGSIPADDDEHAVSADVSGLSRSTTYHFRLVTTNANGTTEGEDVTFTTRGASISGVGTQSVGFDSATVAAQINPNGEDTTYHVEYGTDASYGQSTPESASVGSDTTAHPVSETLTGLTPGTTYHWRIVVTSAADTLASSDRSFTTLAASAGSASCPNDKYRTGPAAGLPDCRAYEMVSPVDKNNGDIAAIPDFFNYRAEFSQSSVDGNKLTYSSYKAFGDALGAAYSSQYIATRGAGGWSTHGISPPRDKTILDDEVLGIYTNQTQFKAFTPDLSVAWVTNENATPLSADAVEGIPNLYRRNNINDAYSAVTINQPTVSPNRYSQSLYFDGYSSDAKHIAFSSDMALTADAADIPFTPQAYEYSGGELRLVSVLPDGTTAPGGGMVGRSINEHDRDASVDHAISEDGSRIFWTANDTNALYVRIDGERTVQVSSPSQNAYFRTASADGSKAIYSTGSYEGHGDLYEFDVDSETRRLIAQDSRGVMGASDDLSHVYFSSREDLAAGATAGEENLYLERDGEVSFVAGLSAQDVGEGFAYQGAVDTRPIYRSSRVTPDGRHILFQSNRSLTGYDNTDAVTGEPDVEVFTYDADADQMTCVSCNPSGARPVGDTLQIPFTGQTPPHGDDAGGQQGYDPVGAAAWIPAWESALYARRTLLDDGSRVFFNSYDALVPRDTNGEQDVYQWVKQGTGGCERADGCVSLISTGTSPQKSEFTDASADGRDVFFHTASSLVAQDTRLIDIYDARMGGGFDPPPAAPDGCDGESCQGASNAPADVPPASANGGGSGNGSSKGKPVRARVRIVGKAVKGAGFSLRVRVSGKGVISGSGSGLRSVRKRVGKAGTYKLAFKLTAKARRTLARNQKSRMRARVRFVASGGKASRATVVLVVKQPKQAHGTRAAKNNSGGAK